MVLPIHTLLQNGKYKIIRFISSGGFGCTYEAEHTMLKERVAIKEFFVKDFCIRHEESLEISVAVGSKVELVEKLKKKFVDEARILYKLNHPGIVNVSDVFEENGTAYYVMDYIEGTSLQEVIGERGALPEYEALEYIGEVCEALRYVHGRNRLHLDIKPGNIMVGTDGRAILIDFGASKHYSKETGENTSTLMGINTPGYAPPEQKYFTQFTPSVDIYALGATLYKLLTGITPPASDLLAGGGEVLAPLPNDISASTRQAIACAMELNQNNRPQSVEEFLAILGKNNDDSTTPLKFIVNPGDKTVLDKTEKEEVVISPNKPRNKLKWWIAAIGVLLLLCVGGFFLFLPQEKENIATQVASVDVDVVEIQQSTPDELYQEGKSHYDLKEYDVAIDCYQKAAEQGHVDAQNSLGLCYSEGKGVEKNDTLAFEWYSKAAEQGHADAQYNLGLCYSKGKGAEKNDTLAFEWNSKAAEQGHAKGQFALGNYYRYKDDKQHIYWIRKSAEQGYADAQFDLGYSYRDGHHGLPRDWTQSAYWMKKAAEQGEMYAEYYLGSFYQWGEGGLPQDGSQAFYWYSKSAEQGCVFAQHDLGYCYEMGIGTNIDYDQALYWYRKAVDQDFRYAEKQLKKLEAKMKDREM